MTATITGYDRASILDLAMICGGTIECLIEFCALNSLSPTGTVIHGQPYMADVTENVDHRVLSRFSDDRVRPATEASAEDIARCPYGGIGEMGIEIDFEIV
jgi:hypothetical protein